MIFRLKYSFFIDSPVSCIVVVRENLMVRARSLVLFLVTCSQTGPGMVCWGVVTSGPLCGMFLHGFCLVYGIIMIDV